ncbi:S-layer homology domain-containing protein [Flavonifractor plautii]|uniref:S-layer homology domain-containing protein n=4 Tax=Flavonifractor plautii TaxID=292800 RepID=UPI00031B6475|nr:S-layer homology domain-containing protein [Flavonifractor plautii]MCQ4659012.1 S-layer homology domain-containing protein [Flavonifractor plautii]MCQ4684889.1 S-layer homology domain-containing protein [Flavonifractor plautii]MCQ4719226.1 S-layer homology domain-containing protein [Flavonifractor plautii]MCQ4995427.1 S-layer homology domain-containing protein [Flavonifractor plautii]UBS60419.1 S-layer homology domain-containing protein [Flavonifractor plautii]
MGAAGIGGGYGASSNFGNITINGGTIIARGSGGGAGIGGGYEVGSGTVTGNVTINGGYVTAIGGSSGSTGGAGIGSGENANYSGTVTINGGVVYAEGGADSTSIGSGNRAIGTSDNGAFTTGTGGNAVIVAPDGIGDPSGFADWDGIFISYEGSNTSATVGEDGTVHLNDTEANIQVWGEPVIDYPLVVESGTELLVVQNDRNYAYATLEIGQDGKLTNNGTVTVDEGSTLILLEGLDQTDGSGTLECTGTVKLPPEEKLIALSGAEDLTYNGTEQSPEVSVTLNLWGYSHTYGNPADYTVTYTDATNAGETAKAVVTSTGAGDLLEGSASRTFTIQPADYTINVSDGNWTVAHGETQLLSKLPPATISIDPSIQDDLTGLRAGNLTWYMDEQHSQAVTDTSLQNTSAGEEVPLYWVFSHSDSNFAPESKSGTLTITITNLPIYPVVIRQGDEVVTNGTINKTYGDENFTLTVELQKDDSPISPDSLVTFTSNNEDVVTVAQNGEVTITGSGTAVITASVAEKGGDDGYAAASGTVTVSVAQKPISVDDSTVKLNGHSSPYTWPYDGHASVTVDAELTQADIVGSDDVDVTATGTLSNANAGNRSVTLSYELTGDRAMHYVLRPAQASKPVVVAKADPGQNQISANPGALTIANRAARTYTYSLSQLTAGLDGLGNISYKLGNITIAKEGYFTTDAVKVNAGVLRLPVNAVESDEETKVADIAITISSTNYEDFTGTITVNSKNLHVLTYDPNGGSGGPGTELLDTQTGYPLKQSPAPTHDQQDGVDVLFIGWTADTTGNKIYTASDTAPTTVANVDINGDTTVYAAWGVDTNGDGVPDVNETGKYTLTYAENELESGTLQGVLPTDSGTYVKGNTVALADGSGLSLTGTTTSDKGTARFVGWSKTQIDRILSQGDTMPAGVVEQVTFTNSDITVYAVWGWDTNDDGKPDITQNPSITSSAGENGSIAPEGKVYVPAGNSQKFDFTPDTGYAVDRVTIDGNAYVNNGVNLLPGMDTWEKWESYTFADVREDHTISVTFGEDTNNNNVPDANEGTVTLTYNANGGEGSAPAGQSADKWSTVTVAENTFTRSGYSFAGWNTQADGSGEDYAAGDAFQLTGQDAVLYAQWSYNGGGSTGTARYTIEASAGHGGGISPDGRVRVSRGSDKTFRITPDAGYEIADVLVDGESVGAVSRYTFETVRKNHTIEAEFRAVEKAPDTGVDRWLNTTDHMAYLNGYGTGLFGPDDHMTRAQAAQMFYNLLLDQEVSAAVRFTDVPADAWYARAVETLASLGMVEGVGGGKFAPERTITRAEFTVMAMRFARLPEGGENPFSDVTSSDWFYDQVVGAVQYGWITGYTDGTFRPEATITRAEVTAITNRLLDRAADEDYVDDHAGELRQFSDVSASYWAYHDIVEATNAHSYRVYDGEEHWM